MSKKCGWIADIYRHPSDDFALKDDTIIIADKYIAKLTKDGLIEDITNIKGNQQLDFKKIADDISYEYYTFMSELGNVMRAIRNGGVYYSLESNYITLYIDGFSKTFSQNDLDGIYYFIDELIPNKKCTYKVFVALLNEFKYIQTLVKDVEIIDDYKLYVVFINGTVRFVKTKEDVIDIIPEEYKELAKFNFEYLD